MALLFLKIFPHIIEITIITKMLYFIKTTINLILKKKYLVLIHFLYRSNALFLILINFGINEI